MLLDVAIIVVGLGTVAIYRLLLELMTASERKNLLGETYSRIG